MDASFDLLSSMSPKFTNFIRPTKKLPSKLALKKHFRRSSRLSVSSKKCDESIISISSGSSCNDSESNSLKPIVISASESDKSFDKTPEKKTNSYYEISDEKYGDIESWLNNVEIARKINAIFKSPPNGSLKEDASKQIKNDIAFNSTFLQSSCKRFDELLDKYDPNLDDKLSKMTIIDDSLDLISDSFEQRLIDDNKAVQDSLKLRNSFGKLSKKPEQSCTKINDNFKKLTINDDKQQQQSYSKVNYNDVKNVLDEIYGKSWRPKKDVLPLSEPRVKKKSENNWIHRTPVTEKPKKKNIANDINSTPSQSNTFHTLRPTFKKKTTESPWTKILQNLCDKETDSEEENFIQSRLNFDEPKEDQLKKYVTNSEKTDVKSKNQLRKKVVLPSKLNNDNGKGTNKKSEKVDKGTKVVPNASFLASLSGSVPLARCDITALIYRSNFKQHKIELTRKLFDLFNQKVFNDAIPKNTVLEWNDKMRRSAGFCRCKKTIRRTGNIERYVQIDLSSKVLDSADRLRDTLIHEMCHAATWIVNEVSDGHGQFWRAWANRALKVFPDLPPISRCHSYQINTKYTYRCQGCGYSVGRHTKSLDTERKCCGYCRGRFEILINKTTKNGETKTMLATPKKTTGFALFVKENYANVKTPDLNHAAVMKLLGENFSKMKT